MHRIRCAVHENRLSGPASVSEQSYLPYIHAGGAWVAETHAGIAGFAVLDLRSSSVWALFIAPDAEGMGIGRELHRLMLDRAKDRGLQQLWLDTSRGTRAERFYLAAGWEKAGETHVGEIRLRKTLRA